MDKNKNRTDLLAAGRKKLQQYRQKKDTKGTSSHGKSSKKSGKSEKHEGEDATASSVEKATKSSPVAEGEMTPSTDHDPGIADSSLSHSIANSEACEVNVASVNPLLVAATPEMDVSEAVLSLSNEPEPKELEVVEENTGFIPSHDSECSQTVDVERVPSLETSDKPEEEIIQVHMPSLPAPDDDMEGATAMAKTNTVNMGEESFLSRQDIPDMSLIQAREDQVTDVGAKQEAEGSGFKQYGSTEIAVESDEACHLPELNDSRETPEEAALGMIDAEQANHEGNQTIEVDDDQPSGCTTNIGNGLSASNLAVPEADLNSEVRKQQSGDIATGLSADDKPKVQTVDVQGDTEHATVAYMHNQQSLPDRSSIFEVKSDESPFEPEVTNSSSATVDYPVSDVRSISMSQIVNVIRELGEDEFQLLLKSRESHANSEFGNDSLVIPDHLLPGFLGKLKEELFLTNFSKDILQLQLTEQSEIQMEADEKCDQFVDEIAALRDSLNDVCGKNDSLSEELAQCKSELQVVASGREELQNQLLASNTEAQEISSRAQQLQISLERSLEDLSSLSKELSDCKSLVDTLQAENDNLNSSLASVTENTRTFEEQKEYFLHENEKLLTELAEYKKLVAAVQAENSSLSSSVASVTDERNKLGEKKEKSTDCESALIPLLCVHG